jgi:tRNA-2-methylthio-N6-dimethylallyladenosine synthase
MSTTMEMTNERASTAVFIETYGCQMNLADSELISGVLAARGYRAVASPDQADVILLNTCAIREHAEERVAQRVRQLISARARAARRVRVGLAGCMAQHHRERLLETIPGLDFVVGPDSYRRLPDLLEADAPAADVRLDRQETYEDVASLRAEGVRAWLTIMRGCDRFCTFCVVPYVRGRERSLPAEVLVEETRRMAAGGYREIVLLGQTVNAYHDGRTDFGGLLHLLAEIDGIERIRFTSPHPADMTESSIAAMRDCAKVSPYLHLPLQSGSDRILTAMDRGHTIAEYLGLVEKLRSAIPDLALSTDIIVGYPGEAEEDFEATSAVMETVAYDHAFLFKYSRRDGTRAYRLAETVSDGAKSRRLERLIAEQQLRATAINRLAVGRTTEVLVESCAKRQPGWLAGKNPQFKTVVFEPQAAQFGDLVTVLVEAAGSHTLTGRQIDSSAPEIRSRAGGRNALR